MNSAISVRHLTKDFKIGLRGLKLRAVDDLSLEIPRGQVYGLLGPNGCGKSTTLKIILGLVSGTTGEINILGFPSATAEARRRTGFLPEAPYFHKFLSGRELVRYCAQLSGVPAVKMDDAVDSALELAAMTEASSRRIGTYSKGMLQRIGLAQAIVHDPELVILDEPTAGVDPVGAAAIGRMIRAMRDQGKTVVLCSHLLGQVEQVCDRVAIMDHGRLVLEGRVDEVLAQRDRHLMTIEGLTPEARLAAESTLAAHGARVTSVTHPRRSLEELFRELVTGSRDA
ncbi:MAG: ABC transporter ATP-binding protein [Verrucomicrobia bacterium]|nr:ABC transporter ATP-binding protein [Verrucomicrobiota bacterium]NBS03799.1 ABC transporter ATP-binding protein [Verrucomicrobiota bacterium]NBY37550.1 ABC transporter ATP-binding protein [Verrucomicrobiota bacterium]